MDRDDFIMDTMVDNSNQHCFILLLGVLRIGKVFHGELQRISVL